MYFHSPPLFILVAAALACAVAVVVILVICLHPEWFHRFTPSRATSRGLGALVLVLVAAVAVMSFVSFRV